MPARWLAVPLLNRQLPIEEVGFTYEREDIITTMRPPREIWEAALGELELQVNKPNFRTWFSKTTGLACEGGRFVVGAPNSFVTEYLERNQRSLIEKTLINLTGGNIQVCFQVAGRQPSAAPVERSRPTDNIPSFNPRYTFESFIVGSSNRMANAAALGAAQKPGGGYNPLFIYGGVGLGKTHLLLAIGHMCQASGRKALYVSGERFTNEFVKSVREKKADDFRNKYRDIDILLVDDVQFIGGKEQTEECFFHTFNDLHHASRQIVLTSDCPPKDLPLMEDRLRSRFEWGLAVEVQTPELKTRLAIAKTRAEAAGHQIPLDVLELIAKRARRSIRELEGCLNRVTAYASLVGKPITTKLAQKALANIADKTAGGDPSTPSMLIEAVADSFQLSGADLLGQSRDKETALARQMAMYLLRQKNGFSLAEIGQELGGRSPATVSHAYGKISQDIENNAYLRRKLEDINRALKPPSK